MSASYMGSLEAKEANLMFKIIIHTQSYSTPPAMTPEQIAMMRALIDRPPQVNPNAHPIDTTVIKNHPPPGR